MSMVPKVPFLLSSIHSHGAIFFVGYGCVCMCVCLGVGGGVGGWEWSATFQLN